MAPSFLVFLLLLTCHPILAVDDAEVIGRGTGNLVVAMGQIEIAYRAICPATNIRYTGGAEQDGVCGLTSDASYCTQGMTPMPLDFASTSTALDETVYAKYPDVQMYPIFVGGNVPIYNLGAVTHLTLTKVALAQIFNGEIKFWDDPRIKATNPNFTSWGIPPNAPILVAVGQTDNVANTAFLSVLPQFYPNFTGPSPRALRLSSFVSVSALVMSRKYTIGYCPLDFASVLKLSTAKLLKGSNVVEASIESMTYTTLELGLSFGNNGQDPKRLSANLNNAQGVHAWPFANYIYIVMRKDTLRSNATCANVQETVKFFEWFLNSPLVEQTLARLWYAPLPSVVRDYVVSRLTSDIRCNGQLVWAPKVVGNISGAGSSLVSGVFTQVGLAYEMQHEDVHVSYTSSQADNAEEVFSLSQSVTYVAYRGNASNPVVGGAKMVFAGVGLVVASAYDFTLDLPTLVKILNGDITNWNDPALMALNPNGIMNIMTKQPLTNQSIVLLRSSTMDTEFFKDLMKGSSVPYTGARVANTAPFADDSRLSLSVYTVSYSLTVLPLVADMSAFGLARIKRTDGSIVTPSWQAIQACASADAYDAATGNFALSKSANSSCYPLSDAIYLGVKKSQCNLITDLDRTQAITFVEWIFNGRADAVLTALNMAPLHDIPILGVRPNQKALQFITCYVSVVPFPIGPLVGGIVGGVVVIGVLMLIYIWRSTKEMRAMRKQFSDHNVAKECAEAISHFDLESVAWLHTVAKPNPIQLSFIRIMNLLIEVKPFIPDQLLSALTAKNCPEAPDDSGKPGADASFQNDTCSSVSDAPNRTSRTSEVRSSKKHSLQSSYEEQSSESGTRNNSRIGSRMKLLVGTALRKCTYCYVRFSIKEHAVLTDEESLMSSITVAIITLAKAKGATVDKVTFDTVALHWNIVNNTALAPLHATLMAMELQNVGQELPADVQSMFWIRISVGFGLSRVSTVSAASQRFFVISGRQVALPIDVVTQDYASKCLCSILISQEVYNEVCHAVKCFPRVWFGDVLLWEPVDARKTGSTANEWMYELQNMESDDQRQFNGKVLLEPFLLAKSGKPMTSVVQAVNNIKKTHATMLSPQDIASLDHLILSIGLSPVNVSK